MRNFQNLPASRRHSQISKEKMDHLPLRTRKIQSQGKSLRLVPQRTLGSHYNHSNFWPLFLDSVALC
jgi:hypothetical protein